MGTYLHIISSMFGKLIEVKMNIKFPLAHVFSCMYPQSPAASAEGGHTNPRTEGMKGR